MAFSAGKDAVFKYDNSSGVLTDISAFLNEPSFEQLANLLETTVLGKTFRTRISGLKDGSGSLSGPWDPTLDAIMNAAVGAKKSYEYGPAGTAGGAIKYSGEAIVSSYSITTGVDGVAEWSAEWEIDDTITRGTY